MKLDRHHFLAPYNLGLLYETLGETHRAISAYEKSVDRNRGFPASRFRLGRLYEKQGLQGRAIEQYARALQIDPGMRDPRRNPMIVDTRLLDRVSIQNYPRDFAAASMASEAAYVDRDRLRKVPLDRSLSSGDLQPQPPEGPATTTAPAAGPTPVRVIAPSTSTRRPPPAPIRGVRRSVSADGRAAPPADARRDRRPAALRRRIPTGPATDPGADTGELKIPVPLPLPS
jgi:hypothetical protein